MNAGGEYVGSYCVDGNILTAQDPMIYQFYEGSYWFSLNKPRLKSPFQEGFYDAQLEMANLSSVVKQLQFFFFDSITVLLLRNFS